MDTVKKIKAILDRKVLLENNIANASNALEHVNLSELVSFWSGSNYRIDVRIKKMIVAAALSDQIEADKAELETIDKQLDAIGALMGAGNV